MRLYDTALSGNCHKVRLLLSILGLDFQSVPVNLIELEQKTPEFLALNPLGKVPVLVDDGVVIWDSQAILVYLARKHGPEWLPENAAGMAEVVQWLSFATHEMWNGPAIARAVLKFNRAADLAAAQDLARDALGVLDARLDGRDWLACDRPSIADFACYPYAGLAWEGKIDLAPYEALGAWFERIEALEGYVGMESLPRDRAR